MLAPVRIAFDPSLPVVAATSFDACGKSFAPGDAFPWRSIGVTEQTLADLWRASFVVFLPAAPVAEALLVEPPKPVVAKPARR